MNKKTLSQTLVDAGHALGFEKATMDKLEALNIPEVRPLSAKSIREIRKSLNVSQGVFAKYLNVTPSTVQKWEQGSVKPQSAALKLLTLVAERGAEILSEPEHRERKKAA